MRRNEEIDRLRAVAILATLYAHVEGLWLWPVPILEKMQRYFVGYDGVLLFFSISGYVISASLLPKLDAALRRGDGILTALSAFFCKRIYRINPSAILWIFVSFIIFAVIDPPLIPGNLQAARASLFNYFNIYTISPGALPNYFGVFWTLSLEEQFYIAFPILLLICRSPLSRLLALAILVIIAEYRIGVLTPAFAIQPLVGGVMLYIIGEQWGLLDVLRRSRFAYRPLLIAVAVVLIAAMFMYRIFLAPYARHYLVDCAVAYTALVGLAAMKKELILPLFGTRRILNWFGTRSFTLYLAHLPLLMLIRYGWMNYGSTIGFPYGSENNVLIFVTWIIPLLIITECSYRFFEKPLINAGHNRARRMESESNACGKRPETSETRLVSST
jgi:peptidoglycan/LPS O-acetylase OafA/YrhL